ncbi:hypothetical protein [Halomonas organivorans]|uniref:Uncharacterized protein n=1 Tax=Halomonas organivorans TaxID=257772 RepID=A0A7W5BZW9_9GAMM|nr:hypothetical protein [Halomonas organivorans]MBB3142212.1 hypothetical protein [Halomonas organivorans]
MTMIKHETGEPCGGCGSQSGQHHAPECPSVNAFRAGRIPAKGGQQARRAAILCQNARFRLYLDHTQRRRHGLSVTDLPDGTHTEQDAADAVRRACGVGSRAEIDHDDEARAMLDRIVADYQRWERQQRRAVSPVGDNREISAMGDKAQPQQQERCL